MIFITLSLRHILCTRKKKPCDGRSRDVTGGCTERKKKNVLRMRVKFFFVTVFPITCLKHLSSMFKSNMGTLALISTELRYQPSGKSLAVTWPTGSVVLTPAGVVICLCKCCAVCPKLTLLAFCPYELQLLCAYSNG